MLCVSFFVRTFWSRLYDCGFPLCSLFSVFIVRLIISAEDDPLSIRPVRSSGFSSFPLLLLLTLRLRSHHEDAFPSHAMHALDSFFYASYASPSSLPSSCPTPYRFYWFGFTATALLYITSIAFSIIAFVSNSFIVFVGRISNLCYFEPIKWAH